MVAASVVAGGSCPQVGSLSAARWRFITKGTELMPSALALESLVNEVGFMVGPIVVVALSASVVSVAGLVCALSLVIVGTFLMVTRCDSEPAKQTRGPGLLFDRRLVRGDFIGFPILHLVFGVYFGSAALALTAAAIDSGIAEFAGAIAAAGGAISLLAGFVYGSRVGQLNPLKILVLISPVIAGLLALLAASTGTLPLIVLYPVAAGCISPMLISAAVLLQRATSESIYVQAITWTGSASAAGNAIAGPTVGALIDTHSWHAGFIATTITIAMIPLVAPLLRRRHPVVP